MTTTPSKRTAKPEVAQKTGKTGGSKPLQAKPRASVVAPAAAQPAPRRADFQAIERDYRTGAFTDQELADKYGKSRQAITKMAKVKSWKKDLSAAVRQATKASLIAEEATKQVAEQVAKGSKATVDAVVAAAETNKQVILSHRQDISRARNLANAMLNELHQVTVNPAKLQDLLEVLVGGDEMTQAQIADARAAFSDLSRLPTRILSVQRLSQAMTRLQALERTAFGLDEDIPPPPNDELADLSDEELDRKMEVALERSRSKPGR